MTRRVAGARTWQVAVIGSALVLAVACSGPTAEPGTTENPRTVVVSALDSFTFDPATIPVSAGETVRFVVTNDGELEHEFVIGTRDELLAHAEAMHRGMQGDTSTAIRVLAGQTKELVYTFDSVDVIFGCLVPGHFPAGMAGSFETTP